MIPKSIKNVIVGGDKGRLNLKKVILKEKT